MTPHWFVRTRYWYRPCHAIAWLMIALGVAFCVTVFLAANRHVHSLTDLLYSIFPYLTSTVLVIDRIAERTSHA